MNLLCLVGLHAWSEWTPYFYINGGDNPPMTIGHYLYDERWCTRRCDESETRPPQIKGAAEARREARRKQNYDSCIRYGRHDFGERYRPEGYPTCLSCTEPRASA